jgi:hypothetical protein
MSLTSATFPKGNDLWSPVTMAPGTEGVDNPFHVLISEAQHDPVSALYFVTCHRSPRPFYQGPSHNSNNTDCILED